MSTYHMSFFKELNFYRFAIMGVAMISVILFHQYFVCVFPFNIFHNYGHWGVDVFLFLSGAGLVNSLRRYSLRNYYKRRLNRILPSCLVCGTMKYTAFVILGSSVAVLEDGLKLGVWSILCLDSWFVYTILLFYIISPLLYRLLCKHAITTLIVVVSIFFINGLMVRPMVGYDWMSIHGILSWSLERLPVFIIGMLMAVKEFEARKLVHILKMSFVFFVVAVSLIALVKFDVSFLAQQSLTFFLLALGMPSFISIIIYFLRCLPKMMLKPLSFFGSYSFEIYLAHGFIFWTFKIIFEGYNPWILLSICFLLTCVIAYVVKQSVNRLKNFH